jgi:hypothetical protein
MVNLRNFDWQHAGLIVVGAVSTLGPSVATLLTTDGLPIWAADVTHAVGFATLLLAMLKASPSTTQNKTPAGAVATDAAK